MTKNSSPNWMCIIGGMAVTEAVGFASHLLAGDVKGYYQALNLPPLAPPSWVFGLVWTILYALIGGVAGWIISQKVARQHASARRWAVILYLIQLALNFSWSIIFFRWHSDPWSIAVVLLLLIINIIMASLLHRFNRSAYYLLIPYLLWLAFASYLTIGVALLR